LVDLAAASARDERFSLRRTVRGRSNGSYPFSAPWLSTAILHVPFRLHPFCSLGSGALLFQGETLSALEKGLFARSRPALSEELSSPEPGAAYRRSCAS
jgi:hypothetical protein